MNNKKSKKWIGCPIEEEFLPSSSKQAKQDRKAASSRDRSKYKKTDLEKMQKSKLTEHLSKLSKKDLLSGRVLAIAPEGILVDAPEGQFLCTLRGLLKKEKNKAKNLITVGDFVLFEKATDDTGSIAHVEERRSILSRQDHLLRRKQQLIAANIDQVLITVTVANPPLKPFLVDRYIIATLKGNMQPIIVVNKIDLLQPQTEENELFNEFIRIYESLNIPVIATSVVNNIGIDQLKEQMKDKASVFSGQSGVGKSSLINIITGLQLRIGDMVEKTHKGSHTTTTTHLIPLSFGGFCIDTPGIRSFGLWDLKKEDLQHYFSEIAAASSHCKYPNCTHSHEPDCAVKQAAEEGAISFLRLESYQKLLLENDPESF